MKGYGKGWLILVLGLLINLPAAGWGSAADDLAQGRAALAQGSYNQAIELLERAIGSGELGRGELAAAHFDQGRAYEAKGYISDAERAYRWALHYDLSNRDYLRSLKRMRRVLDADP